MSHSIPRTTQPRTFTFLISLLVLGLLGIMAVIFGPALLSTLRSEGSAFLAGPECAVQTTDGVRRPDH